MQSQRLIIRTIAVLLLAEAATAQTASPQPVDDGKVLKPDGTPAAGVSVRVEDGIERWKFRGEGIPELPKAVTTTADGGRRRGRETPLMPGSPKFSTPANLLTGIQSALKARHPKKQPNRCAESKAAGTPNDHSLTAAGHRGCNRHVSWPPSLSLGRRRRAHHFPANHQQTHQHKT